MAGTHDYYDDAALLDRLTIGVRRSGKEVVFLVGSAISAAPEMEGIGVPGVDGVIELIRQEFDDPFQLAELEKVLGSAPNKYQAAFAFLLGRRGQTAANEIIKRSVWKARRRVDEAGKVPYLPSATTSDEACRLLAGC